MTKKTRTIIFVICIVLFLLITPYIVLYSLGYQVDLLQGKIIATGGMYVRAQPQGTTITIDGKITNTTGFLLPSVFEQNLIPGNHTVLIHKDNYFDYKKTLPVVGKQVTKLENVILFKQQIPFSLLQESSSTFYPSLDGKNIITVKKSAPGITMHLINTQTLQKNAFSAAFNTLSNNPVGAIIWTPDSSKVLLQIDGNYYLVDPFAQNPVLTQTIAASPSLRNVSFNPQDSDQFFFIKSNDLYQDNITLPLAKNVATYLIRNNSIIWLDFSGQLYQSDLSGANPQQLTAKAVTVKKLSKYELFFFGSTILLKEDNSLWQFNTTANAFENIYRPVVSLTLSPDNQNALLCNEHELMYALANSQPWRPVLINRFSETISNCQWLNNEYIIYTLNSALAISEIDTRDVVNTVSWSENILLTDGKTINIAKPQMYFNQQDKKAYMLGSNSLVISERLIP